MAMHYKEVNYFQSSFFDGKVGCSVPSL